MTGTLIKTSGSAVTSNLLTTSPKRKKRQVVITDLPHRKLGVTTVRRVYLNKAQIIKRLVVANSLIYVDIKKGKAVFTPSEENVVSAVSSRQYYRGFVRPLLDLGILTLGNGKIELNESFLGTINRLVLNHCIPLAGKKLSLLENGEIIETVELNFSSHLYTVDVYLGGGISNPKSLVAWSELFSLAEVSASQKKSYLLASDVVNMSLEELNTFYLTNYGITIAQYRAITANTGYGGENVGSKGKGSAPGYAKKSS